MNWLIRFISPSENRHNASIPSTRARSVVPLISLVAILVALHSASNLLLMLVKHTPQSQDVAVAVGSLTGAVLALLLVKRGYINATALLVGLVLFTVNGLGFYHKGFAPTPIATLAVLLAYMTLVYHTRGAVAALAVGWAMLLGTAFLQAEGVLEAEQVSWRDQINDVLLVGGLLTFTTMILGSFEQALRYANWLNAQARATNEANLRKIEQLNRQITGQTWHDFVVEQRAQSSLLYPQSAPAMADTERLIKTGRVVGSATELHTIYQMITEELLAVPQTEHAAVMLSGPEVSLVDYLEVVFSGSRQSPYTRGNEEEHQRIELEGHAISHLPISAPVIYTGVPVQLPSGHPLESYLAQYSTRSAVLAPITAGGRWFGLLVCGNSHSVDFPATFLTFVSALADQLAVAIDNRRLYNEVQAEARRARALAEAGRLASQMGDNFENGLAILFQTVAHPGGYDRWWFGLLTGDNTFMRRVVASDNWLAMPDPIAISNEEHAAARAARIGEIALINDPADDLAKQSATVAVPPHFWGKHLAIPVTVGQNIIGVLQLGRPMDAPDLDERDIQLASALASQVGTATQNQRLFEQAESQRKQLQTIVDSMPTGILVMDRTGIVLLANHALRELLGPKFTTGASNHPEPFPLLHSGTENPYSPDHWPLNKAFTLGMPVACDDIVVNHPTRGHISLLAQAVPIHDANGQVSSVVGTFQNITELQELERALQGSLRETMRLYEASRAISRTSSPEDLIEMALWQMRTLNPDEALVFLRDDNGTIAQGNRSSPHSSAPVIVDEWLNYLKDEPFLVQRASAQEDQRAHLDRGKLASLKSFPMLVRGSVKGWLAIGYVDLANLSAEQDRFMMTLADQAAITLENHRLLLSTERALQNTAMLYRASRSIADTQDLAVMLMAFARLTPASQTSLAALYLLHENQAGTASSIVRLAATWGNHPGLDTPDTHYTAEHFVFWNEMSAAALCYIPEVEADTCLSLQAHETLIGLGLSAVALIPLQVAERLVGMIMIGLSQPDTLTDHDLRIYESLADQAAISLENNRMYEQTQRRARQLTTAAEISRSVNSILEMDVLLPHVVNLIKESFEYDHAQIFLLNDDESQADLVASTGDIGRTLLAQHHSLPFGPSSIIGRAAETGQPQIALDTADATLAYMPDPHLPHTRSELALPLLTRDHIVGVLDVHSNRARAFTHEDVQMFTSLADTVAIAIDNARLFNLAQKRAVEMGFLFQVTSAATTSPNLEVALKQAMATLRTTMGVANASIFLPDDTGKYLVRDADPDSAHNLTESSGAIERSLVGWVARHNESVIINDFVNDPRQLPGSPATQAAIAVPIHTVSGLLGVLVVESNQRNAFSEDDLRLLQALSGSLAAILQNTLLLREMQIANERLLEVDRLKTNFLAAMSHELRTPLNSIIGFSRVILKEIDGPLTEAQEQDLTTIYDSGKHLLGLVNDILDQAKIEAGKMEVSFEYFKMADIIKGVMSSAVGLTRDKPIRLLTNVPNYLPDAYGDEFRTRQVLLNLISNAAKFTNEGRIAVSARAVEEKGRQYIRVDVEDTGIGIAEKDMPLLFEAFQQIDNSLTRSVAGTGMGLPLAKSLTELQHGRIEVQSQPGVGSIFSILIPTAPVTDEDVSDSTSEETPHGEEAVAPVSPPVAEVKPPEPISVLAPTNTPEQVMPPGPPRIVLAVDNDREMINLYQRFLLGTGYEVIGSTHPQDIQQMVETYSPTAILLDINMPEQDGWQVLDFLKGHPTLCQIPVIMCTIETDSERGLAHGAANFLIKPVSQNQLLEAIYRADPAHIRQPHILLFDDHPDSVRGLRDALESSHSYLVTQVTTVKAALEIIHAQPPVNLVILGVKKPEMGSVQVLDDMRAHSSTARIPVIILTEEPANHDERAILEPHPIYLKSELDEASLLAQIATCLCVSVEGS